MKNTAELCHGVRALIMRGGRVLVLRRAVDDPDEPGSWDLLGGALRPGESTQVGMIREVREETGIAANQLSIDVGFQVIHPEYKGKHLTIAVFTCESKTQQLHLSKEHDSYQWILPRDLHKLPLGVMLSALATQFSSLAGRHS
ncbi:MAG: NUDIX hydrolase [Patescibacteria group bacterium]